MTISEELNSIFKQQMAAVDKVASDLFSELIKVTPVKEGTLKGAWDIKPTSNGWRLSNNMQYAEVIFEGRRFVAGRWFGSEQLVDGLDPILVKYNRILQIKLDKIKA